MYAGSRHRWTCRTCLDAYLEEGAARADAKARAELDKRAKKAVAAWDQAPGLRHRTETQLVRSR